jgi:1-acyl-sn-glycerol-3-phosphate acyltransferase
VALISSQPILLYEIKLGCGQGQRYGDKEINGGEMASWYHHITWRFTQATYCKYLRKKYHIEVISEKKEPHPPFIFLGNHAHRSDPFIFGLFIKCPLHYMANTEAASFIKQAAGKLIGIFSKKKGVPDIRAVRTMFTFIKKGHAIGIFADGDRTWDGETEKIIDNIPRLVKMAKLPLRLGSLIGSYLSGPRWAHTSRQGQITAKFTTLTKEEVLSMSKTELNNTLSAFLYRNDIKEPSNQAVTFTGEHLAAGIQFLLWLCPSCKAHDTIYGEGDTIICRRCRHHWSLDGNLRISPYISNGMDLKDWSDLQKEEIKKICVSYTGHTLTTSNHIALYTIRKNKARLYGHGDLELYKDKVLFKPYNNDKELLFDVKGIQSYVDNFNRSFLFFYDNNRYKLLFNGKNASKWIYFLRYLQQELD